jgi:hypothetical protein
MPTTPELTPEQRNARIEVRDAFRDGEIDKAQPTDLRRWLKTLSTTRSKHIKNYSRDIIRAAYINHIQNSRMVRELDRKTKGLHHWILGLTVGLVVFTVALLILTWRLADIARHTDDSIERLYQLERARDEKANQTNH